MAGKITKSNQISYLSIHSDYLEFSNNTGNFKIKFTPDTVDHLEIIDPAKLDQQIISFVAKKQPPLSKIIFIVHRSVYFEKKISDPADDSSIRQFINKIPLEDILYKIIPDKTDFRLVAFNRDYLETLKKFFEANGFPVILTLTKFDLDKVGFRPHKPKKELNALLKTLKPDDLLSDQPYSPPQKSFNFPKIFPSLKLNFHPKFSFSKITPVAKLISVFVLLLLVLLVLVLIKKPFSSSPSVPVAPPLPTTIPTPIPVTAQTAVIKITYKSSRLAGSAANLKNQLIKEGFSNVTLAQDSTLGSSQKTYLNFSAVFPADLKEKITQISGKYFINSLVQTQDVPGIDVLISAER